jgi:hypothetical protein
MEIELDSVIPFLDVLVVKKGIALATKAQKTHPHWPISQLHFRPSTMHEMGFNSVFTK